MLTPQPLPPLAPARPHVVTSPHGDRIDEYYWLRDDDPRAKRPEVMAHLEAENRYTEAMLAPLAPLQAQLVAEMRSRIQDDDSTPPVYDHGWWVWREYAAGAEYPRLLRQRGGPERPDAKAPRELMLDQPARAAGQAYYRVGGWAVSPDGRRLAWAEDTGGRRIHTLRFKDLASGRMLPDEVPGVLEDLAWANDSRTLFYIRQDPVTLQSGPVWRHRLGTPAAEDVLVYEEPDKSLFVGLARSASERYVLIELHGTDTTETRAVPADAPTAPARVVLARRPGVRHSADHRGRRWFIRTNEEALDFRLVSAPEGAPEVRSLWRTVVPARAQATLEGFALFERGIAVQERVDADTRVRLLGPGGGRVLGAGAGHTVELGEHRDARAAHLRYTVTSMVRPKATHDLHLASGRTLLRKVQPVPGYEPALYATERFWAPARDGLRIPVTLAWRPDRARRDGSAPLLVIGYGSYGLSYDPEFSSPRVSLLDRGFVLAIAHVRGGAELGEAWYEAGRLMHKQNTFNDFVDATRSLVQAGWGDAARVFASGGSAGGLLMGAVANQAGGLYRAIVAKVPFVDVVTTMLDESIPLTANEWEQWGDPREAAAYACMLAYSPYDNLAAQDYPAMLVTTGLWDAQVQYFEPAKYVARLRARKTDARPVLLHVNMEAGHGGASGRFQILAEEARDKAFLLDQAGLAPRS
ncbi:MAG: S9 family peptidase [Burkholderiales bacterium]|nr:S9 family peptidase [Burkholderiales bacterium]